MRLSSSAQAVIDVMVDRGADAGWVSAPHDLLAGFAGISVSAARSAIYELLGAGVIERVGKCRGTQYRIKPRG